jgi:phosphatidylinositol alpha-1,6-mannosyltransferase
MTVDDGSGFEQMAEYFGTPPERFRCWPDGVQKFDPASVRASKDQLAAGHEKLRADGPWIVHVSRLDPEKRIDRVIRAMPLILAKVPRAQLVVIGDGRDRRRLAAEAARVGVEESVVFVGAMDHAQLRQFRGVSELAVTVSERSNRLLVLREALQSGLPVVTLNDGTTEGIIADGVNGFLVEKDDDRQLANAIIRILTDDGLRRRLAAKALETGQSFWGWDERMAVELKDVEGLIRRGRKGGRS